MDRGDAHDLAMDLVMVGVDRFRTQALMNPDPARRWRPSGGASIRTYFIGRCLLELPDVYERWDRPRQRARGQGDRFAKLEVGRGPTSSRRTELVVEHTVMLDQALADMDPQTQAMFLLAGQDYCYEEIAEMLSTSDRPLTANAVGIRMTRARQRARKRAS